MWSEIWTILQIEFPFNFSYILVIKISSLHLKLKSGLEKQIFNGIIYENYINSDKYKIHFAIPNDFENPLKARNGTEIHALTESS